MNISDRIIQYLELKGISKNKFYVKTGLSNGFLDKKPNIGADKIELIIEKYPDINLYWLISGEGEMLNPDENMIIANTVINNGNGHIISGSGKNRIKGNSHIATSNYAPEAELEKLRIEVEHLKKQLEMKDEIIQLLKEQKGKTRYGMAAEP